MAKTLVAYFSATGTTGAAAKKLAMGRRMKGHWRY